MKLFTRLFLGQLIITFLMISIALYVQFGLGIEPCALCAIQRVCVLLLMVCAIIALWHRPRDVGRKIYSGISIIVGMAGLLTALRQVWLEHYPPLTPQVCVPSWSDTVSHLPIGTLLQHIFDGTGDCSLVLFRFLGLSTAEWSLCGFVLLFILSCCMLKQAR